MKSTGIEAAADALLRERATRQALVDSLQADSLWATFVGRMVLPAGTALLFLGISDIWSSGLAAATLAAVCVAAVFWLSLDLGQVSSRLHALTTVLESTGVLAAFIDDAARRGVLGTWNEIEATRSNTPLQPTSGGQVGRE